MEELIRLLYVESQSTKAVLAQTCMGVFFIRSVFDTMYATLLLPKPPADRRGPQFEKYWCRGEYVDLTGGWRK
jgi:hypothetical protein